MGGTVNYVCKKPQYVAGFEYSSVSNIGRGLNNTAQKIKFSIKDFFGISDQIRIFCVV